MQHLNEPPLDELYTIKTALLNEEQPTNNNLKRLDAINIQIRRKEKEKDEPK